MDGNLGSAVVLLLVTVSPLAVLAIIVWQWQRELNQAMRLRRPRMKKETAAAIVRLARGFNR